MTDDADAEAELTNITRLEIGKAFNVPMNVLDGRPWVPRLEEMPDYEVRQRPPRPARPVRLEPTWFMPPDDMPAVRPRLVEMLPGYVAADLAAAGVLPPPDHTLAPCPQRPSCPHEHPWVILPTPTARRGQLLSCDPAL